MRTGKMIVAAIGAPILVVFALTMLVFARGQQQRQQASQPPAPRLTAGSVLDGRTAPDFTLRDQNGQTVTLSQLRGHPVVLTFLDATCTSECPITAQYLDWTASFLGAQAHDVVWLALSVNPANTPAEGKSFLVKNPVRVPVHVLLGTQAQLAPIWRAYHIFVQPGPNGDVQHTLGLYVIDSNGHEREWVDGGYNPKALSADLLALLPHAQQAWNSPPRGLSATAQGKQNG